MAKRFSSFEILSSAGGQRNILAHAADASITSDDIVPHVLTLEEIDRVRSGETRNLSFYSLAFQDRVAFYAARCTCNIPQGADLG